MSVDMVFIFNLKKLKYHVTTIIKTFKNTDTIRIQGELLKTSPVKQVKKKRCY